MEKENNPMSYDHFKKLDANDIIKAKREVRQHVREKDAVLKKILESDK